jgi:hypothetical protein
MNIFYALLSSLFGIGTFAFKNPAGFPVFGLAFAAAGFFREFRGQKRKGVIIFLTVGGVICIVGTVKSLLLNK